MNKKRKISKVISALMAATLIITLSTLSFLPVTVQAASSYYVDSNNVNASDSGPGSQAQPWKTLNAISSRSFSPGDTIYFACGSSYSGVCTVNSSGTSASPIQLASYGVGNKPSFTNPNQLYIFEIKGSYVALDGLKLSNSAVISYWDDTTPQYTDSGAVLIRSGANYDTIQNCEFTQVGIGIKIYGTYATIKNNNFHDLVIGYHDSTLSYGALGISINNSNQEVAYNTFTNCRSTDSPYGADGGAIEIEGKLYTKDNINIHNNKSTGCQGFLEVTETSTSNVTVAYNISDDYQQFIAFDTTTTPYNYKAENNTVIRTQTSNTSNVFTIFYYRDQGPLPNDSWLSIKNNIFYTPACKVLKGTYTYKDYNFPHSNNIYFDGSSDPLGYPLGTGDKIAYPYFVNMAGRDLHLQSYSPAINAGASLGYISDFDNNPVPTGAAPDCGVYEFQGTATELVTDPGFENQISTLLSAPWAYSGSGSIGVDKNAGKARTDFNNAYISTKKSGLWNEITQTITVSPNSTYQLSAFINSSGNIGSNLYAGIRNTSGGNKKENVFTPTSSYTKYTVTNTYTTGPTETSIVIYIGYQSQSGSQWIQLDDVSCTKQ